MKKVDREINCPQCGDILPIYISYSKIAQCPSCGSHIFLEDDSVRLAGKQSVLSLEPSLLELNKSFSYDNRTFDVIGHIRYKAGRNLWDEWWLIDRDMKGYWLSVDDGEYILEKEIEFNLDISAYKYLKLEQKIDYWRVSELDEGVCVGFEGELPEIVNIGDIHQYAHLSAGKSMMQTIEFFADTKKLYSGKWLNPYKIREALS